MANAFQYSFRQRNAFQEIGPVTLAAAVVDVSVVNGNIVILKFFASVVTAVSTTSGNLFSALSFAASVVAVSTTSAFLIVKKFFSSAVAAVSVVTGNLSIASIVAALRRIPMYLHGQIRHWRRH